MKIYIAGPYTKGDVAENVRAAIFAANYVAHLGHFPFVPHLTHFWHLVLPNPYDFWITQDLEWLKVCDAILRLEGESTGADNEVKAAQQMGLPVYHSVLDIPKVDS